MEELDGILQELYRKNELERVLQEVAGKVKTIKCTQALL